MPSIESIKYCYFRDEHHAPRITLCRYENDGRVTYGWSICSPRDNPSKKTGKAIALQRAKHAFNSGDTFWEFPRIYLNNAKPPCQQDARNVMRECNAYHFRSLVEWGNTSKLPMYMQPHSMSLPDEI